MISTQLSPAETLKGWLVQTREELNQIQKRSPLCAPESSISLIQGSQTVQSLRAKLTAEERCMTEAEQRLLQLTAQVEAVIGQGNVVF